ncbi:MAG TPA: hypothetical protein VJA22_03690 [Patescibacteria group bacterium]|nr:hypothetical protein [Patescibacteria group bacterium]
MSLHKQAKDWLIKALLGKESVPSGLAELNHYFRSFGPIGFRREKQEDGSIVMISENFRYGSIITHVKNESHLDEKVVDAILTAFEVPSSYAKQADLKRVGEKEYAFA